MKALVDKLAIGRIEYDSPKVELSVSSIEQSIRSGSYFSDCFKISSTNGVIVKGLVYSTNSRLKIENEQFGSLSSIIRYQVDTHNAADGDIIDGVINIVTNAGEFLINFHITVLDYTIHSSIGDVENYFHFANLVQMNYEEALKLFISSDFKKLLSKNDSRHVALYEGLIQGTDKRLALEEFLITINKKKPVILTLDRNEMVYNDLNTSYGDVIVLTRSNWGYTDVLVEVHGSFLKECKRKLTQDDFSGNHYEYHYLINTKALYKGINYGQIIFKCHNQNIKYNIVVNNADKEKVTFSNNVNEKIIKASNKYLDFRMQKCNLANWANESIAFMEGLIHLDSSYLMPWLFKAQILISQNKMTEAGAALDDFIKNRLVDADKHLDIYCYYLYVRSLEKREVGYTATALTEVKRIYEESNSWKTLWVLLYLDERYEINKSLKYTMIKEQFNKGCRSPFMYFEALSILNEQPRLLRIFNNFELQLLVFASKHNYIGKGLTKQLVDLAVAEKRFSIQLYKVLVRKYEENQDIGALTAICSLLIRGNKIENEYFKWYELGVSADIRLTNLYEYYMFSIAANFDGMLPKIIYMYFIYNGEALGRRQSFLYQNIINNKKKMPGIYSNYLKFIEQYMISQLYVGNMDGELAVIYNDVLKVSIVDADIAKNLPDAVMTYEITCDEPRMKEVIVIHKETTTERVYKLIEGKAYVSIYTEDPIIIFVDTYGKRYSKVSFELVQLLDMEKYLETCFELRGDNEYLALYFAEKYMKYQIKLMDSMDTFKRILLYTNIRISYKKDIISHIVDYYDDNVKGGALNEYLLSADKKQMDAKTREKVIQMMVAQGMYDEAYKEVKRYGYSFISPRNLAVCCTRIINKTNKQYDLFLVETCAYVFREGKYNEEILEYLSKYFYGTLAEMVTLWNAEDDFVYENHDLEERILVQAMFTRNVKTNLQHIFRSFYRYGVGKTVKLAFYTFCSYHIFMKNMSGASDEGNGYIFKYLEADIMDGMGVPNICNIALLEYASENKKYLTDKEIELYTNLITKLSSYNVMFEFYKKFNKWIPLPFYVTDKTIVDYRTLPDSRVNISYTIGNKEEECRLIVEEMTSVQPGIFIKDFTLFYGDKLNYYISEVSGEESVTTDSHIIEVNDPWVYHDHSRYSMLNNIIIANENNELEKKQDLIKDYMEKKQVAEQIFYIC